MEIGARGSNGQHARQLVEMAQNPEHVTVTTLLHSMAVYPARGQRMIQHSASRKTVQVGVFGFALLNSSTCYLDLKQHGLQTFAYS